MRRRGLAMHIHLPKALHDLPEVLREVGIIVVGIVIAILLEQGVELLHWRREVHLARAALHDEMRNADRVFSFRVAVAPCVARRLDALEAVTEKVALHQPVPRLGPVMPDVGNAFNDNIWESYRAAQTLTHFDDTELRRLSLFYLQLGNVRVFNFDETRSLEALRVLQGDPGRLGPADVAGLRVAIQQLRFDNAIISGIANDELAYAKALRVPPPDLGGVPARVAEVCAALPVVAAS
jgi:hypothetical protein